MKFSDPCPKSIRMAICFYQRQLMEQVDPVKREVYQLLLRSLDRQLKDAEQKELKEVVLSN